MFAYRHIFKHMRHTNLHKYKYVIQLIEHHMELVFSYEVLLWIKISWSFFNESTIRTRKFREGQDLCNVFKMWNACKLLQLYSHFRIEKSSNRYVKTLITNFACDCMAIVIKAEFRSFPLSYHQIKRSAYYRNTPKNLVSRFF